MPILRYDLGKFYLQIVVGPGNYIVTGLDNYAGEAGIPEDPVGNIIIGGGGNDDLFGGYGTDRIFGGAGDDYIIGYGFGGGNPSVQSSWALADRGGDYLDGGAGNDRIGGGGGDDILVGGSGNDFLSGSRGRDTLFGGAGDDVLRPGDDADILWGGSGADSFVYSYSVNSVETPDADGGRDVIMDFESGVDTISVAGYLVEEGELEISPLGDGALLSFQFYGRTLEIEVRGVSCFAPGDILYA